MLSVFLSATLPECMQVCQERTHKMFRACSSPSRNVAIYDKSAVRGKGGDFFRYTDVEKILPFARLPGQVMFGWLCIIIAATAVAMAAGSIFGWIDFFKTSDGSRVPKAAQEIMQNSGGQTYTISPVVFTVHEMYSDKNILMVSTQVSIADGEKAIICVEPCEAIGANGENGRAVAQQLGVDPVTTWVEAAKQLNLPLYKVEALAEAPAEFYGSEAFYDPMFNNDGSLTFFSVQPLNGKVASEQLDCRIWLFVEKVNLEDPEASEAANEIAVIQKEGQKRPCSLHVLCSARYHQLLIWREINTATLGTRQA